MRSVSVVLILAVIAMASAAPTSDTDKPHYNLNDAEALFETFIKDNNRTYKDAADREVHYHAFVASLEKINKLNAGSGATYGINKFADYTENERKNMFGLRKSEN